MNAQIASLPLTTPSTSPVVRSFTCPYAAINPQSNAQNVIAIVQQVVHAPIPDGYTDIADVIQESENDPRRAAALARARQRLATQLESAPSPPTIASLRLKAGLSQSKVAEQLGNSQSSYSLIESGKRTEILHSTFEKLVQILGVSRDDLAEILNHNQEKLS